MARSPSSPNPTPSSAQPSAILATASAKLRAFVYGLLPEIGLCAFMTLAALLIAWAMGLTIVFPSGNITAVYETSYLYQFAAAVALLAFLVVNYKYSGLSLLVALALYMFMLVLHFNMKWWMVYINPASWDEFYWQTDQALYPLVAACFWIREALIPLIPRDVNAYLIAYLAMYIVSFCYHSYWGRGQLRNLMMSMMIFHLLGGFGYLLAPALGPFLYEEGFSPNITEIQATMHSMYQQALAQGPGWLAENGSANLVAGLGAMPSLHVGGILVLFFYIWQAKNRWLIALYLFMVCFVTVTSVASRWHYLIDLPFGALLAWISFKSALWYPRLLSRYFGYTIVGYTATAHEASGADSAGESHSKQTTS